MVVTAPVLVQDTASRLLVHHLVAMVAAEAMALPVADTALLAEVTEVVAADLVLAVATVVAMAVVDTVAAEVMGAVADFVAVMGLAEVEVDWARSWEPSIGKQPNYLSL